MNIADRKFWSLANEIAGLSTAELYYRIRSSFEKVDTSIKKSCADFFNRFNYWGRLDPDNGIFEEIELKVKALSEHINDFARTYERLADYRSKRTLYAVLSNWYRYDFTAASQAREYLFDDYFDLDLVQCERDETFADLGAFVGDTVLSFINNYGPDCYKRIYCYEITPDSFSALSKNLNGLRDVVLRPVGVADAPGRASFSGNSAGSSANTLCDNGDDIEVTTLDDDIKEPLTIIKADIEGSEYRALLGARRHISNERPKLLISVYHNNEDLWRIPELIDEILPGYRFFLRYRSSHLYPTEITLFAL